LILAEKEEVRPLPACILLISQLWDGSDHLLILNGC